MCDSSHCSSAVQLASYPRILSYFLLTSGLLITDKNAKIWGNALLLFCLGLKPSVDRFKLQTCCKPHNLGMVSMLN